MNIQGPRLLPGFSCLLLSLGLNLQSKLCHGLSEVETDVKQLLPASTAVIPTPVGIVAVEIDELLGASSILTADHGSTGGLALAVCTGGVMAVVVSGDRTVSAEDYAATVVAGPASAVIDVRSCTVARNVDSRLPTG